MSNCWQFYCKFSVITVLVSFIASCASAPKPAECKGPFKPINPIEKPLAKKASIDQLNKSVSSPTNAIAIGKLSKIAKCNEGLANGNQG